MQKYFFPQISFFWILAKHFVPSSGSDYAAWRLRHPPAQGEPQLFARKRSEPLLFATEFVRKIVFLYPCRPQLCRSNPVVWKTVFFNQLKLLQTVSSVGPSDRPVGKLCGKIRRPANAWIHALSVSADMAAGGGAGVRVCLWRFSSSVVSGEQTSQVFAVFSAHLCHSQACPADHRGKAGLFVAAGPGYGHAQPAACTRRPAFPRREGNHWHPSQFPAALSRRPRQGRYTIVTCTL